MSSRIGQSLRRQASICSWQSTILSERCFRRPIRVRSLPTQTNSLAVSARLSGIGLSIQTFDLATWRPRQASRCAISRSFLHNAALHAVVSSIRSDWIRPRAFFEVAHWRAHTSRSARLPTPVALMITITSHENSADGSVVRQAPIGPDDDAERSVWRDCRHRLLRSMTAAGSPTALPSICDDVGVRVALSGSPQHMGLPNTSRAAVVPSRRARFRPARRPE
jgi:hypothetical protein